MLLIKAFFVKKYTIDKNYMPLFVFRNSKSMKNKFLKSLTNLNFIKCSLYNQTTFLEVLINNKINNKIYLISNDK